MKPENNKKNQESFLKKILKFIKKHPGISGTIATVCFYCTLIFIGCIILVTVFYSVISAFSTFFGFNSNELSEGKYKDLSLTELQEMDFSNNDACYKGLTENNWQSFWMELGDSLGVGINSECEFLSVINDAIKEEEKKYEDYGLELSQGLIVSTIIYSYSSDQEIQEGEEGEEGEAVDISNPMTILRDIAKEGLFKVEDIEMMVENMIMREAYWYYTCESTTCNASGATEGDSDEESEGGDISEDETEEDSSEEDEAEEGESDEEETTASGYKCKRKFYFNVRFDRQKFLVFLRYGEDAALYYEAVTNHNNSVMYTCAMCYEKWNSDNYHLVKLENEKYLKVANPNTSTADNIVIELTEEEIQILTKETKEAHEVMGRKYNISHNSFTSTPITYKDGYIYKKFPRYLSGFEKGTYKENSIFTPKNIQKDTINIVSYETTMNQILDDEPSMTEGTPDLDVKTSTKNFCPSESGCNCANGGRTPGSGGGGYAGEKSCIELSKLKAETKVRLYTCKGYTDYETRLPGGGDYYQEDQYIAKELIDWKTYLIGLAGKEMSYSDPIEALKLQMLLAQTYAINRLMNNSNSFNYSSNGELMIQIGTCAQTFDYQKYKDNYINGSYKEKMDNAYKEIQDKILMNSDGNVTYAKYGGAGQNQIVAYANDGMTYTEILKTDFMKNYQDGYYKTASLMNCTYDGIDSSNPIVLLAASFLGKADYEMPFDIGSMWCARFVSHVLGLSDNEVKKCSSASVSRVQECIKNDSNYQFCNSKYWAERYPNSQYTCEGFTPMPGDLIFFQSKENKCGYVGDGRMSPTNRDIGCFRHIGIVTLVTPTKINFIHGNTRDCKQRGDSENTKRVCLSTELINSSYMIGYGRY